VTLVALALSIFFASQIGNAQRGVDTIRWQLENVDKQMTQLKEGQKQLGDLVSQREDSVKQAQAVQQQYNALLNDVMELARTDADAQKIIEKWKIQRTEPAPAPPAETKKEGQ
jgi:septation ring formation regulator EzrA